MQASDPLYRMFTALPRRYDLVNHAITLGLDARWRRRAARECLAAHPRRVLDLCCGTGDLVISLAGIAGGDVALTGIDYSPPMLEVAARKVSAGGRRVISFIHGDVAHLPFPDGCFDCVGISFAFRNLTYQNPRAGLYLDEVRRVLAGGGRFVVVETSQPESKPVRWLFHLYLRGFVSRVGYLCGQREAYRYLTESASRFFRPGEVGELLLSVGFRRFSSRPLFFGAAAVYVAVK